MRTASSANFESVLRLLSHFFLATAPLILVLSGCSIANSAFAQSLQPLPDVTCRVPPLKAFWGYNRIDKKRQKVLRSIRDYGCLRIRHHEITLATEKAILFLLIARTARCNDDKVRPWVVSHFTTVPDNIALMWTEYCQDTYDPNEPRLRINLSTVGKKEHWLRVEEFCQTTRWLVFSSNSSWLSALGATDVPSEKRLEEQTNTLCDRVRSGKLTVEEGTYRWEQELLRWEHQSPPEEARKLAKSLEVPLKALMHLLESALPK